jgi:ribosomal protein S18 acetylase RimI-like enzyme
LVLTCPQRSGQHRLRPFNPSRDLKAVADLMQIAFGDRLDAAGQVALDEMRRVARKGLLLHWYRWLTLDYSGVAPGYVWVEDSRVVGNVSLRRVAGESAYMVGNVAVHPDWRQRGIATALMRTALDDVRSQGSYWTGLEVRADNSAARRLYEKLGFHEIGRMMSMVRPAAPAQPGVQSSDDRPLRRAKATEGGELLRLARRSIPPVQQAFFELRRENYRVGLGRWLECLLQGQREVWLVVPGRSALVGAVRALSEPRGRFHRLEVLMLANDDSQLGLLLVCRGLARLRGASRRMVETTVPASSGALIGALESVGFRTSHTLIQMRSGTPQRVGSVPEERIGRGSIELDSL